MRRSLTVWVLSACLLVVAAPAALAVDPAAPGSEIGRVRIPAIGLDEVVREGIAQWVIDLGVAHWEETAAPGEAGNVVLAGHRTLGTRPFYHLGLLDPGDDVYVRWDGGVEFAYRVTEVFVVPPTGVWIVEPTRRPTVTMFTCHPKGSARQRLVVRAELVPRAGPITIGARAI